MGAEFNQITFGFLSPKPDLETGSFSGFHRLSGLGRTGYLSATRHLKQPLCGNEEGWGPLSPIRYDFTPCFIDVWVAAVAAFGILFGSIAVWWLVRKRQPSAIAKDWHFWTKQVGCCAGDVGRSMLMRQNRHCWSSSLPMLPSSSGYRSATTGTFGSSISASGPRPPPSCPFSSSSRYNGSSMRASETPTGSSCSTGSCS